MPIKYEIRERTAVPPKKSGPTVSSQEREELKEVLRTLQPTQSLNLQVEHYADGKNNLRKLKRMVTTASNELKEVGAIETGFIQQESEDRSTLYVYLPDPNAPKSNRVRPKANSTA